MADSNPVFVKIFRDKEKFKELMDSPDWQEAVARAQNQRSLCLKAGLNAMIFDGEFAAKHDPVQFFPAFELDSEEWRIWTKPFNNLGDMQWVFWPTMPESNQYNNKWQNIPLKVIEEIAPLLECGLFVKIVFFYRFYFNSAMLVGQANGKFYPIVFWGDKEVYDEIQQKLADLEAKKQAELEAEKRKAQEIPAQSTDNFRSGVLRGFAYTFFAGLIVFATYMIDKYQESIDKYWWESSESKSSETVAIQTAAPVECIDCSTWQKPCDSVYDLQVGKVLEKRVGLVNCPNGKEHCYILYFKEEHTASYQLVTKDVFDKVKLGDEIPFKRPEY